MIDVYGIDRVARDDNCYKFKNVSAISVLAMVLFILCSTRLRRRQNGCLLLTNIKYSIFTTYRRYGTAVRNEDEVHQP